MKIILLFLVLVIAFNINFNLNAIQQQDEEQLVSSLRNKALSSTLAYDILESLTTEVGPRMAGTAQDEIAVKWAVAKLQSLGFDKVWTEPVEFKTWIRGEEAAEIISPFPQQLHVTTLGSSVGTPSSGIQAEIIHFKTIEDLVKAPEGIAKGKIVFISNKMARHKTGKGYGPAVKARSTGAVEAARKGAIAVIIRSIGTDSHRLPHTGMMAYKTDVKKIPAAALSNPDADLLVRMLKRKKPVQLKLTLGAHEGPLYTSHNVIGEVIGSSLPHEKVIIGGHLDSWDLGTGAVDDGAGIAITMAAAKIISGSRQRPKRSIRLILWSNEEQGLIGAKAYAKSHLSDISNHITGAESDFGAGKIYAFSSNVVEDNFPTVEKMKRLLAPLGIEYQNNKAKPGPDLIPLYKAGMSVFRLQQDGTDYFDLHHTADDTLDKVDPESLAQNTAAYVVFAFIAANSNTTIGREVNLDDVK